jgi:DNA repair exonuclease SbcCD ATPase subunit/DNA repair exonuclease SbcCD nuclease subunit
MSLKYIFHLSDLHIRNGDSLFCRYEEYNNVFNNTISSIKNNVDELKLTFNDFIIIISGDIFHNKNVIGNYGLLIYKNFIQLLTKIGRLIIFSGNHDLVQNDNNVPSLVYSSTFDIPNLTILNDSQSFVIDNIGFSYVSIEKTLDNYRNSGRIQNLPPFPTINEDVKFKIALFHGTFSSSKLYNGDTVKQDNNPYPLEWVQDFDYVILGDIHKRQIFTYKNKTHCGYSGSLIQQNFGEDIIKHGYLIWDLFNKQVQKINVYNEIGYINIKENDNQDILIRFNGKYEKTLEYIINKYPNFFPKKLEIKTFSNINFQILNTLLKSHNIQFNIISRLNEKSLTNCDYEHNETLTNVINNDYILSYFKQFLSQDKYLLLSNIIHNKEFLLFNINDYPTELHNDCLKRNKELSVIINSCINDNDVKHIKPSFIIKYLEWDGLLCYQNKNWINLTDLDTKTFMIKGKNGTGKSAIYDILLLAIWGENTKKSSFSSGIINHNKKNGYTIIDILLNGQLYRIQRDYYKRYDDPNKLNIKHSTLYKFIDNDNYEFICKDSACNIEIKKLFGDIDTFLSSSMITQNLDNDILKLDAKKTLEIIDKSCNVEYIYHLYNLFKTAINKYRDFKKIVESKKEVYEKLLSSSIIDETNTDEINSNKEQLSILNEEKKQLEIDIDEIKVDIKDPKSLTIIRTNYDELINSIDTSNLISTDDYPKYIQQYNELKFILKDDDLNLLYNSYSPYIHLDVPDKPCDLSFLNKEKDFLKDYLPSFNINDNYDIDDLNQQLLSLNNELTNINLLINQSISNKPVKPTNIPSINKNQCIANINKLYHSFEDFNNYILNNPKLSIKLTKQTLKQKYTHIDISFDDYNNYKNRYNELSFLLKNINVILPPNYNPDIDEKQLLSLNIIKPCELSFLQKEKAELNDYLSSFDINNNDNIDDLNIQLSSLINNLNINTDLLNNLISTKPTTPINPNINKMDCLNNISRLFNTFDDFTDFIQNNSNTHSNFNYDFNYDYYKNIIILKNNLEHNLQSSKQQLSLLDEELNNYILKQQDIIIINKPTQTINKSFKSSASVSKELKKINYNQLLTDINHIDNIFDIYNKNKYDLNQLQLLLDNYNNELLLFTSNDDCKFNPNCEFCCKRPWVVRIKELEILILKLQTDINSLIHTINNDELINDYPSLLITNDNNKNLKLHYENLILWNDYFKFKENYDKINKHINLIISNKNKLTTYIEQSNSILSNYIIQINSFISFSFHLFQQFKSIELFDDYIIWENNYNQHLNNSTRLNTDIKLLQDKINFNIHIKPRIINYLKLFDDYQLWLDYNNKLNLIRFFEFNKLKHIITLYEINNFKTYELFELFNSIQLFDNYTIWENNYNQLLNNSTRLNTDIKILQNKIHFNIHIKPRIINYLKLFDDYQYWIHLNHHFKIIKSYQLFYIKQQIELFDKYQLFIKNKNLQPLISRKFQLVDLLKSKDTIIQNLNNHIIKHSTINNYNQTNKHNYNILISVLSNLDNLISTLETIIINFQTFRIDIYEKQILNNLVANTNLTIKKLCHKDTKPFQLDYIINVSKDIIHINWLIKNDNIDLHNSKQIISISQASGFQHFVISLALRMSLFLNKYEVQNNQLFIDEGFVNFDKFNLSVVPSFLKSLLSFFNNIVIVSHIDLIHDTIEDCSEISFNKSNSISSMTYSIPKFPKLKKINK